MPITLGGAIETMAKALRARTCTGTDARCKQANHTRRWFTPQDVSQELIANVGVRGTGPQIKARTSLVLSGVGEGVFATPARCH